MIKICNQIKEANKEENAIAIVGGTRKKINRSALFLAAVKGDESREGC